ncbi:MAG: hypothetical protein ACKVJF_03025 [Flavobacteriales bacterium]
MNYQSIKKKSPVIVADFLKFTGQNASQWDIIETGIIRKYLFQFKFLNEINGVFPEEYSGWYCCENMMYRIPFNYSNSEFLAPIFNKRIKDIILMNTPLTLTPNDMWQGYFSPNRFISNNLNIEEGTSIFLFGIDEIFFCLETLNEKIITCI